MRKLLFAASGLVLTAILPAATSLPVAAGAGRTCKENHWHHGSNAGQYVDKDKALRAAKRTWGDLTALEYGGAHANFDNSADQKIECELEPAGTYKCHIMSRPCSAPAK